MTIPQIFGKSFIKKSSDLSVAHPVVPFSVINAVIRVCPRSLRGEPIFTQLVLLWVFWDDSFQY